MYRCSKQCCPSSNHCAFAPKRSAPAGSSSPPSVRCNSKLGWAVRPPAAGEPLVPHSQHNAFARLGCPSAGGQRTIGRPRKETAEFHARRMRRKSETPESEPGGWFAQFWSEPKLLRIRAAPSPEARQAPALRPLPQAVLRSGCGTGHCSRWSPSAPKSMLHQSEPNHSFEPTATGKPASAAQLKR